MKHPVRGRTFFNVTTAMLQLALMMLLSESQLLLHPTQQLSLLSEVMLKACSKLADTFVQNNLKISKEGIANRSIVHFLCAHTRVRTVRIKTILTM